MVHKKRSYGRLVSSIPVGLGLTTKIRVSFFVRYLDIEKNYRKSGDF